MFLVVIWVYFSLTWKKRMSQNLTIANFVHQILKYWPRLAKISHPRIICNCQQKHLMIFSQSQSLPLNIFAAFLVLHSSGVNHACISFWGIGYSRNIYLDMPSFFLRKSIHACSWKSTCLFWCCLSYKSNYWKYLKESCSSNFIYNFPWNSLQINYNASFLSYFRKYDRSRQHSSSRSSGINGLI